MTDNSEQIEIVVDANSGKVDAPANDPVIEIVDPGSEHEDLESSPKNVDKALKKLQKKLEKEKRARSEAELRAQQAEIHARVAFNDVSDSNIHLVGNVIETVKRDQEILTAHLKSAMEHGDYDKAAEIQHSMATNNSKLVDLERGYAEMRAQPRQPIQPVQPQPREITVDDLIERVTPRSAKWLKENRDSLKNAKSIRIMARAHDDAIDMGVTPESDAYFRFVEQRLGIDSEPEKPRYGDEALSKASQPSQKRSSPPSAPVSRAPLNGPLRPGVIRLTADQIEAARISGVTPQEYHANLVRERERNR